MRHRLTSGWPALYPGRKRVALMKIDGRVVILMTLAGGLALSGCVSSPTYGTDKTANAQLLDDVSNMASFGAGKKKNSIDYKPRPDLVRPGSGGRGAGTLPAPQDSVASAQGGQWPESPEQRRKRLRDEITAHRDDPGFVSPVESDGPVASNTVKLPGGNSRREDYESRDSKFDSTKAAAYKRMREEQQRGSSTTRRYLSEPPLDYRQPASTAAVGELGEDEARKEREAKKAARKSKSWREILPWE